MALRLEGSAAGWAGRVGGIGMCMAWCELGRLLLGVGGVDGGAALGVDEHDGVGLGAGGLHAGGSHGHTGDGEAFGFGAFAEEALDFGGGDVAFEGVTFDDGGVAGHEGIGDSEFVTVFGGVGDFFHGNEEAVGAEVLDPVSAASAGGVLVDLHLWGGGLGSDGGNHW